MTGLRMQPREAPPGPTTTFRDLRDQAVDLRLQWTSFAAGTLKNLISRSTQQSSKDLIESLELQVVHIMYYDNKFYRLSEEKKVIEKAYTERGYIFSADELTGKALKDHMTAMRTTYDRLFTMARAGVDKNKIRIDEIEKMYFLSFAIGSGDAINSGGTNYNVTEMLEVLVGQMDEWNRGGRMACTLEGVLKRFGVPNGSLLGVRSARHLPTIKADLQSQIGQSLTHLEADLKNNDAYATAAVKHLRRTVVALKDVDTLQACFKAQEESGDWPGVDLTLL
ncbi:hypothetical protein LTR85_011449 [Meristemomyces frigidus]|nr:hypothetical protein LTR85_011449 [Meristemomyces frigidus]